MCVVPIPPTRGGGERFSSCGDEKRGDRKKWEEK